MRHPVAILYSSSQNSLWHLKLSYGSFYTESQSFIHQVRILSHVHVDACGVDEAVAILYSSSQNSLSDMGTSVRAGHGRRNPLFIKSEFSPLAGEGSEISLTGAAVAILYSSSQNSLP